MIIITTHNGKNHLENLLSHLNNLDLLEHKVLVVDSGSSDIESIQYLEELKIKNPFNYELIVDKTEYSGYDSGVIIHTMRNYDDERYIFIHDSSLIKNNECLLKLDELMKKENVVVPFLTFDGNSYDNDYQKKFCESNYGSGENRFGIFASIFAISKNSLAKINKDELFIPTNKEESRAMERCWSVVFEKSGLVVETLEGEYNPDKITNDGYHYFSKFLIGRQ